MHMTAGDRRPGGFRRLTAAALPVALSASCAAPLPPLPAPAPAAPPAASPLAARAYVAPTDGPTARLLMRGSVPAGDVYGVMVFDDPEHCTAPRVAGAGSPTRVPKTTQLAAGRLATLEFFTVRADKSACRIRFSFTPAVGKSYLVAGSAT